MDPDNWLPLAATVGGLFIIITLRANGTYWLGRAIVAGTARSRWARMLDTKAYRVGSKFLNRWGAPAVTLCFLTVGLQTMVLLGAGVTRMPLRRFLPACTVGSIIWSFMYGTIGFIGFIAIARLWQYSPILTIVLGLAAAAAIVLTVRRRPSDDEPTTPEAVVAEAIAEDSPTA